ncbi:hypothetical protein HAX54_044971 [Datura stramonium]|uniref:F-box domain-containing protein n=1 Tax=Datura stramonium TaxID=4076 RepID=A0ABS8WJ69_DATST|nr:hypothetical protein [Datura stramonium]
MTQVYSRRSKRAAVEDRISDLPRNVTNHILGFLPVKEAARTSILYKRWRHIWPMLPYLVLDNRFCKNLAGKSLSVFKETVDTILLQHLGVIDKFVLDVSGVHLPPYENIDRWMLYATRNGVKDLTFKLSIECSAYKLPSHVFNCLALTHLKLFNCVFKPPNSVLGFHNLTTLYLERITFVPVEFSIINAPLLMNLTMRYCDGTQHLSVVSSWLQYLSVFGIQYPNLNCFTNCNNLRVLHLDYSDMNYTPNHDERSTLEKLLFSLAPTHELYLGSLFLKCHKVRTTSDNAQAVLTYLGTPACLDRPLNKLKHVIIHWFKDSKAELFLVKLLFARAPYLIRMSIEQAKASDSKEERHITTELMRFPRASPKAELFYLPSVLNSTTPSRRTDLHQRKVCILRASLLENASNSHQNCFIYV